MAKVNTFLVSSSLQNVNLESGEATAQLTGPLVDVTLDFFPTNFSFCVCVGIIEIDNSKDNVLKIELTSPNDDVMLISDDAVIPKGTNDKSVFACLDVKNLVVKEDGVYKFSVFYNDEVAHTSLFPIYKKS